MTFGHHMWFWVAGMEPPADEPAAAPYEPKPAKPAPQLPPEVWQTQPVDAERAWAATRAMCAGVA